MTTRYQRYLSAVSLIPLAFSLVGCISSKPQAFKYAFLPSTPAPDQPTFEQPPHIASSTLTPVPASSIQRFLTLAPGIPEVDARIARAEDHFEFGKRLQQAGDTTGARKEWDAAVDLLFSTPEGLPGRAKLERKLDQMVDAIYRYDLEGMGPLQATKEVVYDKSPLESILELTFPTDPNLRPKVKEEINATLSQLPLEANDAVLSYIHYFSTDRGHRTLVSGLRRAGRYRPLIQRILDEEGVPQELIYLAQAESGFFPRARSNKAAVGMWQFVQFRGREYGLMQSPGTDDRMDPERATRAAAKHLRDLYATFGDWYLAMAAYNCGPGCVDHAVQRTGYADFWQLSNLNALPRQTINYVPLIVAITIMAKNAKDYNLELTDSDAPLEYDTIEMPVATNLSLIADAANRPLLDIQELNPSLLKPLAPCGYALRVPKGTSSTVLMALDTVPLERRASWRIHRVANGETLAEIARHYSTPATSITAANQRMVDFPEPGDLLVIPAAYRAERQLVAHAAPTSAVRHRTSRRQAAPVRAKVASASVRSRSASRARAKIATRSRTAVASAAVIRSATASYKTAGIGMRRVPVN